MAYHNRIPTNNNFQYDNGMGHSQAPQGGYGDQRRPVSSLTDRIMRTTMNLVQKHTNHQLEKMDYATQLHQRQQAGEDISWRNRNGQPSGYQGGYEGHQYGPQGRYQPPPQFPPPPQFRHPPGPPPQQQRYEHDADMRSQFGDVPSEHGLDEQEPRRPQTPRQTMEQHLEGLPAMIQGMLSELMAEIMPRIDDLARRVEQMERGQPAAPLQQQTSPPLPPRTPANFGVPAGEGGGQREFPGLRGDQRPMQRPPQRHRMVAPPVLPQRHAAAPLPGQFEVQVQEHPETDLPLREEIQQPAPRRPATSQQPPKRKPVAAPQVRTEEEPARRGGDRERRPSVSTISELDVERQQELEQLNDDLQSNSDHTHDHNDRFHTRPLAADMNTSAGGAAGSEEAIRSQLGGLTLEQGLANAKVYANLSHQGLEAAERLSR